ncbi:MAG: hypothetical protein ABI577_05670 [bacterium]
MNSTLLGISCTTDLRRTDPSGAPGGVNDCPEMPSAASMSAAAGPEAVAAWAWEVSMTLRRASIAENHASLPKAGGAAGRLGAGASAAGAASRCTGAGAGASKVEGGGAAVTLFARWESRLWSEPEKSADRATMPAPVADESPVTATELRAPTPRTPD